MFVQCLLLVVSVLFPSSLLAFISEKPNLTKLEATAQAKKILKQIGFGAQSEPLSAEYIPNSFKPGTTFWLPCWNVKFREGELTISDADGKVVKFISDLPDSSFREIAPGEVELPENGLAQKAIYFAKVLKVPEISQSRYEIFHGGMINSKPEPSIMFVWKRRYSGIEYYNQHFAISLDTYTGKIISFGVVYKCPPPLP